MSSSRSIAAARQRRAGEAPPVAQRGPVTSMGSQQAFAQQQMQQKQMRPPQPNYQQPQNSVIPPEAPRVPVGKLSLGDAFALVTIRLGRLETIIQKLEAEGVIGENAGSASSTMEHDENMRLVDDTVIRNIIARLGDLEKNNSKLSTQMQSKEVQSGVTEDSVALLVSQCIGDVQTQIDDLQSQLKDNSFGLTRLDVTSIVAKQLEEVNNNMLTLQNDITKRLGAEDVGLVVDQKLEELKNQVAQLRSGLYALNMGVFTDINGLKNQVAQLQSALNVQFENVLEEDNTPIQEQETLPDVVQE